MKHIKLNDWSEFAASLKAELADLKHHRMVLLHTFCRVLFDLSEEFEMRGEVDRLALALETGTDRDAQSDFSNYREPGNEIGYDHDAYPAGKKPQDIIYAFLVDPSKSPYLVHRFGEIEPLPHAGNLGVVAGMLPPTIRTTPNSPSVWANASTRPVMMPGHASGSSIRRSTCVAICASS